MANHEKKVQYPQIRLDSAYVERKFKEFCDRNGRQNYCTAASKALREFLVKYDPGFNDDEGEPYDHKPERKSKTKGK